MVSRATAVLPVWRSPMISSRWPRPIGISASIALRPVAIGSCTDLRGMMPGALTSTRDARVRLDRALAVDRIAETVDDAAEQALADRHLDDGAGALDGVAFLDGAVVAEDHDADVVGFEVQRHAADAAGELDHLAGLDVVEAVDAGDAVADRQHLADLGDLGLLAEILDLLLEDRGDLSGADIHQPTSFMAILRLLSLVRSELSIMRLPILTIRPPSRPGSTRGRHRDILADRRLQRVLEVLQLRVVERDGRGHLGLDLAALARDQRAEALDHVRQREQAPVAGDQLDEIGREPADAGFLQHRGKRLALLVGRDHRAANHAAQIAAVIEQRLELLHGLLDGLHLILLGRELEQRGRIAPRHARHHRIISRHVERSREVWIQAFSGGTVKCGGCPRLAQAQQKLVGRRQLHHPAPSSSCARLSMGRTPLQQACARTRCRIWKGVRTPVTAEHER